MSLSKMGEHCCLCLPILATILTTIGALNTFTDSIHSPFGSSLRSTSGALFQDSKSAAKERSGIEPYFLTVANGQSNSLPVKLAAYNFYKKLLTQNNSSALTEADIKSGSHSIKDYSSQVQLVNPESGSLPRYKFAEKRTPSKIREVRLLSTHIDDNITLKTNNFVKDCSTSPCSNYIGLRGKSLSSGLEGERKDAPNANRIVKRIEEGVPILDQHRVARSRFARGVTREKRNSFWIDKSRPFLSNSGTGSDNTVVYKNADKWLEPLTEDEMGMRELLQEARNTDSVSAPVEAKYKISQNFQNQNSGESSQGTRQDSVDVIVKDLEKMDKGFPQSLETGNYYYDDSGDVFGDLSKRDNHHNDRIYAFIKQGPRPSQRMSAPDAPRGSSFSRLHDKMERSQHKKLPPKTIVSAVTEGVCEPDRDGTTPLRCPSNKDKCLYDDMICDGTPDCAQGEDEAFTLCVLRHWTLKWFRKLLPDS